MPTSSCKEIREALADCLQQSDCVLLQRHSASECLRTPLDSTLPLKCQQLKKSFGECRRGMLDMRKRFRGNLPITFNRIQEGAREDGEGYQLYAGKTAFVGAGSGEGQGKDGVEGRKEVKDWREVENERYRRDVAEAAAKGEKP